MSGTVSEVHLPGADSFVFQGTCCFDPREEQGRKQCACSAHGQALAQEWTKMQPVAAPLQPHEKKMVLSSLVCHLAEEDSTLMETEAGKNQTKAR